MTSGGYGYTVGRSIAYAYLPPEQAEPGTEVAVEIFGRWVAGEVAAEPLFDPKGERARGLSAQPGTQRLDRAWARQQAGEDVLGTLDVLAHQGDRTRAVALSQQ